jgi:hypothetical protein
VTVPLVLPHRFLASLIGARRPTVSTALGRLAARGELERLPDGTWLVHGTPDGVPTAPTARVVQFRRPVEREPRFERERSTRRDRSGELR